MCRPGKTGAQVAGDFPDESLDESGDHECAFHGSSIFPWRVSWTPVDYESDPREADGKRDQTAIASSLTRRLKNKMQAGVTWTVMLEMKDNGTIGYGTQPAARAEANSKPGGNGHAAGVKDMDELVRIVTDQVMATLAAAGV